jgi:phosphoribosylformylglycinamidine synthase
MKFGIIVFPGSNCDHDCYHVTKHVLGHDSAFLWHKDTDLDGADCLVLPGGFSYGDYLRSGAMAACSPVMESVKKFADGGGLVIGICNGFQILQEAGLLPGSLMRNDTLKFICRDVFVRVEHTDSPFTNAAGMGAVLRIPIAHHDGNFFADAKTLARLENNKQVLMRYCSEEGTVDGDGNPNGSVQSIAGVTNEKGNVFGMMPHPERCSEAILGNRDGVAVFESIVEAVKERT